MKSCTVEMFEKDNNFELNYKNKVLYQTRLCPDTHKIKDWWKLKNEYSNHNDRKSFNVQVALCDNSTSPVPCAPIEDTIYLLNQLMFSFYVLEDTIEFGSIKKKPYKTVNTFHSQFQLDYEKYLDNNNYVKFNRAFTTESNNPLTA